MIAKDPAPSKDVSVIYVVGCLGRVAGACVFPWTWLV
jgi:hypothetical protein